MSVASETAAPEEAAVEKVSFVVENAFSGIRYKHCVLLDPNWDVERVKQRLDEYFAALKSNEFCKVDIPVLQVDGVDATGHVRDWKSKVLRVVPKAVPLTVKVIGLNLRLLRYMRREARVRYS